MNDARLKLLAVTRKPDSPSFEQRVQRFVPLLAERGIDVTLESLGKSVRDQRQLIRRADEFDGLWWHRHLLSPWVWRAFGKVHVPIVYDFDDAMVYSVQTGRVSRTRRMRFAQMTKRCDAAIAASEYLADLARPYAPRVAVSAMAIDLPDPPQRSAGDDVQLLWLGSLATQPFLESIRPVLEAVGRRHPQVTLRLVAHEPMAFEPLQVDFRPWSPDEQERALTECDIGLCPMPDTLFTRGKCPFKVVQYMAYAMPWVGSAVGENLAVADQGVVDGAGPGCCAADDEQWSNQLTELIEDPSQRRSMGHVGRAYAEERHDRVARADWLAALWRDLVR